jgi:VWFA-related protein
MPSLTGKLCLLFSVLLVLTCLAAGLQAQVSAPVGANGWASVNAEPGGAVPDLPATETIRKRVDEVNVVFTVTTPGGRFVRNLSLDELNVLDNQKPPERINYFRQQSDLPLRVALLVDLSDSIKERFEYEKIAAAAFLDKVVRRDLDQVFLVGFDSDVHLMQDFTGDVGALSRAIQRMKPGGNTRLYDAIRFAAGKLQHDPGEGLSRRAIIIISDGEDTYSHSLLYDALQSALRAQVTVYALSTNDLAFGGDDKGDAVLGLLSVPTGGRVFPASTQGKMAKAFAKVKEALHSQYVVAYKPAEFAADGRFRSIRIVPRDRKMMVNCRRGYFAPREAQNEGSILLAP